MIESRLLRHSLTTAIAATLVLACTSEALAQSAASRAEERRTRQTQAAEAAPAAAPMFSAATREEPPARASAALTPKLKTLFKAYDDNDVAAAQPLADEIIANPKANPYEKAISARIVGSLLLGTDDTRAASYLQQAVAFDGLSNNEHFESMLVIGQLQLQQEDFATALATLDTFLAATGSQDPQHLVLKGNALYRLKRYPEAIAVLKPAVEGAQTPRADWSQLLMATYAAAGQPAEAARVAEQVASSTPGDRTAQLNLAATYLQSEQPDKAAEVYERLRASGQLTEDRDYRNLIALYANADGKEAQTIAVINEGFAKSVLKPDAQAYTALAQAYYFSEQTAPAIDAYQKAAPLADNGEAYLNLAKILANEGRAAESKAAAQQALDKGIQNRADAQSLIAR